MCGVCILWQSSGDDLYMLKLDCVYREASVYAWSGVGLEEVYRGSRGGLYGV